MTIVDRHPRQPDLKLNRRAFLRAAGARSIGVWAGASLLNVVPVTAEPGHAPMYLDRIGIQLYTLRSLMAQDVAATLDAVARIGYAEVEFAGYHGHSPTQIREWLDASGLTAPATHIGLEQLVGSGLNESLEAATTLGHKWLVLPWIAPEKRNFAGYLEVAAVLNKAGAIAQTAGCRVAYHNHAFEFEAIAALDNHRPAPFTTGFDLLAQELDPALVDLEVDLHWSQVGGADPLELFGRYPGRFRLCHLKGLGSNGEMVDVGEGVIDWPRIFANSEQAGFLHYFVEHDNPPDALASATASFNYLSGRS